MTRDEDHFRTAEEAAETINDIMALPTFEEQAEAWRALLREDPFILHRDHEATNTENLNHPRTRAGWDAAKDKDYWTVLRERRAKRKE